MTRSYARKFALKVRQRVQWANPQTDPLPVNLRRCHPASLRPALRLIPLRSNGRSSANVDLAPTRRRSERPPAGDFVVAWEADLHGWPGTVAGPGEMHFGLKSGAAFDLISISLDVFGDPMRVAAGSPLIRFIHQGEENPIVFGWENIHGITREWLTDDQDPFAAISPSTIRTAPEPSVMIVSLVGVGVAALRMRSSRQKRT
jgi:hypothetical protein